MVSHQNPFEPSLGIYLSSFDHIYFAGACFDCCFCVCFLDSEKKSVAVHVVDYVETQRWNHKTQKKRNPDGDEQRVVEVKTAFLYQEFTSRAAGMNTWPPINDGSQRFLWAAG